MAFAGADIGEMRALAERFERQAKRLSQIAGSSTLAIQTAQWTGANIDRVREEWSRIVRPQIAAIAQDCERLAIYLRNQAEQQRETSAIQVGEGSRIHPDLYLSSEDVKRYVAGFFGDVPPGIGDLIDQLRDSAGNVLLGVDVLGTLLEVTNDIDLPVLDKVLAPIGILLSARNVADAVAVKDYLGALIASLDVSVSSAAWIGKLGLFKGPAGAVLHSLGPLALGVSAFQAFVNVTLPTTPEQQRLTVQKGAEHLFGKGVRSDDLTLDQAQGLVNRYEGPWGVFVMISDTMDATADKIFPWNWR